MSKTTDFIRAVEDAGPMTTAKEIGRRIDTAERNVYQIAQRAGYRRDRIDGWVPMHQSEGMNAADVYEMLARIYDKLDAEPTAVDIGPVTAWPEWLPNSALVRFNAPGIDHPLVMVPLSDITEKGTYTQPALARQQIVRQVTEAVNYLDSTDTK